MIRYCPYCAQKSIEWDEKLQAYKCHEDYCMKVFTVVDKGEWDDKDWQARRRRILDGNY